MADEVKAPETPDFKVFEWDKQRKRVKAPNGQYLSATELVTVLNNLWVSYYKCGYAWRIFSDGIVVMDTVYLGALEGGDVLNGNSDKGDVENAPTTTGEDTEGA